MYSGAYFAAILLTMFGGAVEGLHCVVAQNHVVLAHETISCWTSTRSAKDL